MSAAELFAGGRAVELRRAFDASFAAAPSADDAPTEELLAIRIGDGRYAIRLGEIGGLFADRKITPIAGAAPAFLGIAGFRGAILPAYDLRLLLGHAAAAAARWLAVARQAPVAFAFDGFDGRLRLARDTIAPRQPGAGSSQFIRDTAPAPDGARPILHFPALLETIGRAA
jgi:chemotaxis signal transduction protein